MSDSDEDEAYYDLAQPSAAPTLSAASTIVLNQLDDLEFRLTGCDLEHTARDRRRAVAKLTDAAVKHHLPPVWRAAKRLLSPKDVRYLLTDVLPKPLLPKELGSVVQALAPDGAVDSRDFAVFYGELGAIERARRELGVKGRGVSATLRPRIKRERRRPEVVAVPQKGTRAFYEAKVRHKTREKQREERFFGGKARFWGAHARPPTMARPRTANIDTQARALRSAFLKLLAAALDYDRVGEGTRGLDVLGAPMPKESAARLLFDLFHIHIDDAEAAALVLAFPSPVRDDAVDCAALRRYFLKLARDGLAGAADDELSEPEMLALDDEPDPPEGRRGSPGLLTLDEESEPGDLDEKPEVMAFGDDGAEVLAL